jgi:membrane associated rhomboid family serine protease
VIRTYGRDEIFDWVRRCPVIATTGALAIGVSVLMWTGRDVSLLFAVPGTGFREPWRLATSALPHLDILHLGFNLWWLAIFGRLVEGTFGSRATAGILLLLAVGSAAWQTGLSGGGCGLSGVGYGLFGMLWALDRSDRRFRDAMDTSTVRLFVGWFLLCIVLTRTGMWRVGNVAHGSGAILGGLLGFALSRGTEGRAVPATVLALLVAAGVFASATLQPSREVQFDPARAEAAEGFRALERNEDAEAERRFRSAVALDPEDAGYRYDLGIALQRQRRFPEALAEYREAARLAPGDPGPSDAAARLEAWLKAGGK